MLIPPKHTTRATLRRMAENVPVVGVAGVAGVVGVAGRGSPRGRNPPQQDLDFVRSEEEDGNAISSDLKSLEAKISKGNVNKSAQEDLAGVIAATSGRKPILDSMSSSYDNMTSNAELDIETVFAPAGKLGIVVDSSNGGPTVHSIRESSPLIGILNVGDKIISIDDINVSQMSAGGVTKLMGQKAQQSERKIAFQKSE
jgi:C-terminal processing protease CtpA/Prc